MYHGPYTYVHIYAYVYEIFKPQNMLYQFPRNLLLNSCSLQIVSLHKEGVEVLVKQNGCDVNGIQW